MRISARAISSESWRDHRASIIFMVLACLVTALLLPATAQAAIINSRSGWRVQPLGTITQAMPVVINGGASLDAYPLVPGSVRLTLNGQEVPSSKYVTSVNRNLYIYWLPSPALPDGRHTATVSVFDTLGRVSAYQWTFFSAVPPTAAWAAPANGAVVRNGHPRFAVTVSDNAAIPSLSIAGEVRSGSAAGPVVATFGGSGFGAGTHTFTPENEIPPGTYHVSAKVTDATGNIRTLSGTTARTFTIVAPPAMTIAPQDCTAAGCHGTTGHPGNTTSCDGCHVVIYHEYAQCNDCHAGHSSTVTVTGRFGPCTVCHDPDRSGVRQHTPQGEVTRHESSCNGCHSEDVVTRHAFTPTGSLFANQCDLCHDSADPRVSAAVAAGDVGCGACHDVEANHGAYDVTTHTASDTCVGSCHVAEVGPEHTALAEPVSCAGCHQTKVAAIRPWDDTCAACHPVIEHASASHAGSDALIRDYTSNFSVRTSMSWKSYPFGCSPTPAAGQTVCHDIGNLATLHDGLPDGGCAVCHTLSGTTAGANECITCHGTGWYNPSTSSGTIARPGSDHASSSMIARVGGSGSDSYSTVVSNDADASYLRFETTNAQALFGRGSWWMNPATASITNVAVQFRAKKMVAGTTASRMTVVLDVGGTIYVSAVAATNPSTTAWTLYTHTFATNPRTGVAWTPADLNDPTSPNGLRAFGVRQTAADAAPIGVTEVLMKVTTPATNYPVYPVSGGNAHHYGNYLRSPELPSGEWSSAIYTQYCYDRCHVYPNTYAYYGQVLGNPTYNPFNAYEGTQMWSSLMGDPNGNSPLVRNLTLAPITLPAGSSTLDFMTNYILGASDTAQVEISTDGGTNWDTLSGTENGAPVTVFAGTAGGWRPASYDLSAYAGQSVRLRFRYTQAPTSTTAGWCIDNVNISADGTVLFSDDAETLKPEWDGSSHWRRIQYALRWLG